MHIICDSRECLPLKFNHPYVESVCTESLKVGDYGCRYSNGYVSNVFFERKSLEDLFGTLGGVRKGKLKDGSVSKEANIERFKREIERAKKSNSKLILIVECSLSRLLLGSEHSTIEPIKIFRTVLTLFIDYGLIPVFCNNRDEMALYIAEYYTAIGRRAIKKYGKDWTRYDVV